MKNVVIFIFSLLSFTSCTELMTILNSAAGSAPLTEKEVADGLKEALTIGSKNVASRLSAENGYYGDRLIKIPLPEEADVIVKNISKIPGGDKLIEDVVLRINRSAEDAAKEAAPIFVNSISQMTISDAFNILRGEDNAATIYLKRTTYNDLYNLYKPKIQNSTDKDIIGGISTAESWDALTGKWNSFANSLVGKAGGFKSVNTDLDDFLTKKALDGIFLKVEKEEYEIRKNVSARITPLLKRVFGSLDE
jgi:hypothetical protein